MAISANDLFTEAKCFLCYGVSMEQALTLALEKRWLTLLNPSAILDPDGLVSYARCYLCLGSLSLFDAIEIAMLEQIATL